MTRERPETTRQRRRTSTALSYLALFLALAGTAWAAATIGSGDVINNSLKSVDLKNNAGVKTADVRNRTLGGADVANGSLSGADFGADSVGGADVSESTLSVGRIQHALGGAVGQQVNNSLQLKLIPNSSFTQGATETDQIFGAAQITFPAACAQPRSFVAYLLLDDPTNIALAAVGFLQVTDNGVGTVTRRVAFVPAPFGFNGPQIFRTGADAVHQFFLQAGGSCNSGAGITIDSVEIDVSGQR